MVGPVATALIEALGDKHGDVRKAATEALEKIQKTQELTKTGFISIGAQ
jgi:hypothetical protein